LLQTALSPAPAVTPGIFPDPVLSASVYRSGRLCEVVARLVAPFWREYRDRSSARGSYLWLMRYARCGEHLKIRIHAPDSEAPLLRELLQSAQAEYFAKPVPPPPASARRSMPAAPPVDAEDRATADYPEGTFLWTAYGRSPLSLGYRPFLDDDAYCASLTRCLGAGAEIVLDRLEAGPDGECPYAIQSEIWRDAMAAGLLATSWPTRERALYLLYHRDCLLRYLRKKKRWTAGANAMAQVLAQFDRQAGKLTWDMEPAAPVPPGMEDAWTHALRDLAARVFPLLEDPAFHVDPFADHPAFPVFFKAFHGLANQIGLDAINEALFCHLLIGVAGEQDLRGRPVRLKPELE
jgi:hypothetical protein